MNSCFGGQCVKRIKLSQNVFGQSIKGRVCWYMTWYFSTLHLCVCYSNIMIAPCYQESVANEVLSTVGGVRFIKWAQDSLVSFVKCDNPSILPCGGDKRYNAFKDILAPILLELRLANWGFRRIFPLKTKKANTSQDGCHTIYHQLVCCEGSSFPSRSDYFSKAGLLGPPT